MTASELGALLLEQQYIRRYLPPGNVLRKHQDPYVYLRCRLDIPFPILEVAPEPAAGHAVSIGPLASRPAAVELMEQLNSLFGLRHCGRRLVTRQSPSAYGQMGRCLSPCLGDLDPNLYRRRLDAALGLFAGGRDLGCTLAGFMRHLHRTLTQPEARRLVSMTGTQAALFPDLAADARMSTREFLPPLATYLQRPRDEGAAIIYVSPRITEILRQLRALKQHQASGHLIPCGWEPGRPTLPERDESGERTKPWETWKPREAF